LIFSQRAEVTRHYKLAASSKQRAECHQVIKSLGHYVVKAIQSPDHSFAGIGDTFFSDKMA
jgi:hypothetical protein